jgi:hypothetical protein
LLSLALLASLASGLAGSFAASQLRPTFFDAHTLREVAGLPLLGTVSKVATSADKQREKKDAFRFSAGLGLFILLYGLAIAVVAIIIFRAA